MIYPKAKTCKGTPGPIPLIMKLISLTLTCLKGRMMRSETTHNVLGQSVSMKDGIIFGL